MSAIMDGIESLSQKIKHAADLIMSLKQENKALRSELVVVQEQLKQVAALKQQNHLLKVSEQKVRTRLEKLSQRIEQLLSAEPMVASHVLGGQHE